MIISTRALAALSLIFASAVVPATSHRSRRHDELFSKSPKSTEASKSKESNKSSKSNKVSSEPSTNPSTDPSITPSSEPSVAPNDVDTAKPTYSNRFFRKLTMGHEDGVQRIVELPLDTVDSIFEKRDFEVDQKPIFHEKTAVLTKAQCDALMNYIDKVDSFGYEVDSRSFPLSAEDLIKLVGNGALREIVNFYGKSFGPKPIVREILLHRFVNHEAECSEGSCQSTYFDWHTDSEVSSYRQGTIVIPLNEDSELIGGDLYYLGRDGGPIRSSRTQGKATAHADKTLHAIAPFEGTRDTLILHFDVDPDITDPHPGMPYNSWRADLL